jgi:hypothetical protein
METNEFKITIRGIGSKRPTITYQSLDKLSGALYSETRSLVGAKASAVVQEATASAAKFHAYHREAQAREAQAMSKPDSVE